MHACDPPHCSDVKPASPHPVRSTHPQHPTPALPHHSRRAALATAMLAVCTPALAASPLPPPPPVGAHRNTRQHRHHTNNTTPTTPHHPPGNCPECLGEVDDALNRCNFDAPSCVSVYNDDEEHFFAPWSFDLDPAAAADELVRVATGGGTLRGLGGGPLGLSRGAAASYILGGTAAVVTGMWSERCGGVQQQHTVCTIIACRCCCWNTPCFCASPCP